MFANEIRDHHSKFCKEDSKVQTCVLPQSCFQPHCEQSRTHFEPSLQNLELRKNFIQNRLNKHKESPFKACKKVSKVQTCVLPQSCFQPHCEQSRTHFEPSLQNFELRKNFIQNRLNKQDIIL